jgi:hypothetical protein
MTAYVAGIEIGVSSSETYNQEKQKVDAEHSATYIVIVDSDADRENTVAAVPGVPYIGMVSPLSFAARCISREIKERGPRVWEVTARFSTNFATEPSTEFPWDRLPTWSWSVETVDEPMLCDAVDTDIGIWNSAGEPMVPPTRPIAVPVLTISRYELNFDPDTILDYVNTVNQSAFWGAAAGKVFMAGISANQEILDDWRVWKTTYTLKFKMDTYGWKLRLLDQGTYYFDANGQKTPFGDKAMQQVIGNLDGSGDKNETSTPVFIEYNRYAEAEFGNLQLGPWPV